MKKVLLFTMIIAFVFTLGSCNMKNADEAKVEVIVKNSSGMPQKNARVYMYTDFKPSAAAHRDQAKINETTNDMGVAAFNVHIKNHNITDATQVYFAVYYDLNGDTYVTTHNPVMLRRGETQKMTITLPVQ